MGHILEICSSMFSFVVALAAFAALASAQDPAGSWLTYAHTSLNGLPIQHFYAEAVVPKYPSLFGGSAAYWIGIEDRNNLNLIQPIMVKHEIGGFHTFVEHFDWHTGNDEQSAAFTVKPGVRVFGQIDLQKDGSYIQMAGIAGTNQNVTMRVVPDSKSEAFTNAYIVLEHQPLSCAEFSSSGEIVFSNIRISYVGGRHQMSTWTPHVKAPACNSTTTIVNPDTVKITWNP